MQWLVWIDLAMLYYILDLNFLQLYVVIFVTVTLYVVTEQSTPIHQCACLWRIQDEGAGALHQWSSLVL